MFFSDYEYNAKLGENETLMMRHWLEAFVLGQECMEILNEFHAQPTELSDVARFSWATETLHAIEIDFTNPIRCIHSKLNPSRF